MKSKAKIIIIIYLLFINSFLFLFPISIFRLTQINGLLCIIFILINIKAFLYSKGKFNKIILLFILLILFEMIVSKITYNQKSIDIIIAAIHYFSCLMYFIYSYYLDKEKLEFMKKGIVYITLILSILMMIQYFLYTSYGIKILYIDYDSTRFDSIRIGAGSTFISLGILLSVGELLNRGINNKKKKYIYLLVALMGMLDLVFIAKTRAILIVMIICIFSMLYVRFNGRKSRMNIILLLIMSLIIIMNSSIFNKFQELSDTQKSNTTIRIDAVSFYLNQTKENIVFGTGIIREKPDDPQSSYVLHGSKGIFYHSDVGIIGFLSRFGLLGLLWYVILIYKIIVIVTLKLRKKRYENIEKVGYLFFILTTSATLIIFDSSRIIFLPLILKMIEE